MASFFTNGGAFTYLLLKLLPDFCWQTFYEVLTMAEQLDEDVNEKSLSVALCRYEKMGYLEAKKSPYKMAAAGRPGRMYKRKTAEIT